ncbi:MAG: hypothetical protein HFH48_02110 [Lachnospiraceae bacterium]|nr:hypothetical protein [Lachnospiraceae bacterium]
MKSMKKRIEVMMAVLLLAGACLFAKEGTRMAESLKAEKGEVCIVIDAGQGGGNQRKMLEISLRMAQAEQIVFTDTAAIFYL